jgi:hypothetical protein
VKYSIVEGAIINMRVSLTVHLSSMTNCCGVEALTMYSETLEQHSQLVDKYFGSCREASPSREVNFELDYCRESCGYSESLCAEVRVHDLRTSPGYSTMCFIIRKLKIMM